MKLSRTVSLTATFIALSLSLRAPSPASSYDEQEAVRPNVLVILTDDQDVDSLAAMRKLMSYPEGSWIHFANAFVPTSLCGPSRATLLTGQYPHHHRVTTNKNGVRLDEQTLLPVWLDDAGYNTVFIGKYHLRAGAKYVPLGWDQRLMPKGADDVDVYSQAAVNYVQTATTTEPWFMMLSYLAPHAVANPPERYRDTPLELPPPPPNVNELDVSDKPSWVRQYPLLKEYVLRKWRMEQLNSWRETLAIDDGVADIVTTLRDTGQLENTLIIFVGDNGMSWGSHRKIGKWCPYEECSRVPLLIRYPEASDNRTVEQLVSVVDLAGTIAAYTGVTPTRPQDGQNLLPLMNGETGEWRNSVLLERHINDDYVGIRVPGWKYIEYRKGFRELYDLTLDPYEMENVAGRPEYMAQQAELALELDALLGE